MLYEMIGPLLVRMPLSPVTGPLDNGELENIQMAAIAVSSRSLYDAYLKSKKHILAEVPLKIKSSLRKYIRRMANRTTPFGLFAGVATASISDHTTFRRKNIRTKTRPDMSWFVDLIKSLEMDSEIQRLLSFRLNSEAFVTAQRIWLEVSGKDGPDLISVAANAASLHIVKMTQKEEVKFVDLVNELTHRYGFRVYDAEEYCRTLCQNDFLHSNLRFSLNTESPLEFLIEKLKDFDALAAVVLVQKLQMVLECVNDLDSGKTFSTEKYLAASTLICELTKTRSLNLLQVDMAFELESCDFSTCVRAASEQALEIMLRLSTGQQENLIGYRRAFETRYQAQRLVPLVYLFNEMDGLGSPYQKKFQTYPSYVNRSERNSFLLRLALGASSANKSIVNLSEVDIQQLTVLDLDRKNLPVSVDFYYNVIGESRSSIDANDLQILIAPRAGDASAGRTLGRFASLLGASAQECIALIHKVENDFYDNAIIANTNYWPNQNRFLNVALSACPAAYSISAGCCPVENTIELALSDVSVGIENGRFFAVWNKTGQRIIAMNGNMLHSSYLPDKLRFLVDIVNESKISINPFDWGPASDLAFTPRLVHGQTIICPAAWNLDYLQHQDLRPSEKEIDQWRMDFNVPRQILLSSSIYDDNRLLLDLENGIDKEILIGEFARSQNFKRHLIAQEYIPTGAWNDDHAGHKYETELVGTYVLTGRNEQSKLLPMSLGDKVCVPKSAYLKPIGSDWLYLRIECTPSIQDLIIQSIASLIALRLKSKTVLNKWFFVRYYDDSRHHLRIRLNILPSTLYTKALPAILPHISNLLMNGTCSNVRIDTYDREIERYGGPHSIDLIERIFSVDSDLVAQTLNSSVDRIIIGVLYLKTFLGLFPLTLDQQRAILSVRSNFHSDSISQLYRLIKNRLIELDSSSRPNDMVQFRKDRSNSTMSAEKSELSTLRTAIEQRMKSLVSELVKLEHDGMLTEPIESIIESIVHMHCNRLHGIDPQKEATIRGILCRLLVTLEKLSSSC